MFLQSGQQATIFCGGRSISFASNRGNGVNLNSGTRLTLIGCHASFFRSAAVAYSLEVERARDLTARALTGQSGSALVLEDSIMLMPKTVRSCSVHVLLTFLCSDSQSCAICPVWGQDVRSESWLCQIFITFQP